MKEYMSVKRVRLKEKSPEFAEDRAPKGAATRGCDMLGCKAAGEHKAPKDRGLKEYYCFCTAHAQEYNKAWDYFSGMSQTDIEKHIRDSMFGDRPTWVYTTNPGWEDILRARVEGFREFVEDDPKAGRARPPRPSAPTPEEEALEIMSLSAPVTLAKIKERYRTLMKAHHPDRNQGNPEAEELVKKVNMAYTILKAAHEKYETLR